MGQSVKILEARVASGPTVSQSTSFNEWLKKHRDRTLKSLEMESAGVALAAYLQKMQRRTLILRGISDFGDKRKKELDGIEKGLLRRLAVRNAFRVLRQSLLTIKPSDLA
jgi:nucleoside phosphorylase